MSLHEELTHVEITGAHIDAFGSKFNAFLVDTASKFIQCLFVGLGSVLSHEKATKGDVERCCETLKLFTRDRHFISTSAVISTSALTTLEQVPVRGN